MLQVIDVTYASWDIDGPDQNGQERTMETMVDGVRGDTRR